MNPRRSGRLSWSGSPAAHTGRNTTPMLSRLRQLMWTGKGRCGARCSRTRSPCDRRLPDPARDTYQKLIQRLSASAGVANRSPSHPVRRPDRWCVRQARAGGRRDALPAGRAAERALPRQFRVGRQRAGDSGRHIDRADQGRSSGDLLARRPEADRYRHRRPGQVPSPGRARCT